MDEPGAEPDSARNALQPRVRSAGGWSPFTFAAISLVALGLAAWSSPAGKRRWHGPARLEAQPQELTIMAEPGRPRDQVVTCRVKNVGGEALMIQRATACCGSKLISDPAGQRVGPQQTIAFHARVTLPTPGQMNRTAIDVLTDAPSSPLIRCELKLLGEPLATPRCILAPDRVYLARRTGHDPQSEFILETIEEAHSQPWITAMSASDPAVSVTKLDVQVARNLVGGALVRRYRWLAVCAPSATRQDIRGTLEPQASRPSAEAPARIGFEILRGGPIRCVPERLLFVVRPETEGIIQRTVVVRGDAEQDWEVSSVAADAEWLSADLRPRGEDGAVAFLDVRIDPTLIASGKNGPHGSLLVIQTSGDATGEVTLPVEAIFRTD